MTKTCSRCRLVLVFEEFPRSSKAKDGRSSWCKKCHQSYTAEHRDPERTRQNTRDYQRALKELRERHREEFDQLLDQVRGR